MSSSVRRHLLALVLMALAWVWAVPQAQQPAVQALAHELVHLQSVSHHHRDDATLKLADDARAEMSHHHASDIVKPLAWCAPRSADPSTMDRHVLVTLDGPYSLSVVREGPLRPPRALRA